MLIFHKTRNEFHRLTVSAFIAGRHLVSKTGPTRTSTLVDSSASQTVRQLATPSIATHRAAVEAAAIPAPLANPPMMTTNVTHPSAMMTTNNKNTASSKEMSSARMSQKSTNVSARKQK
jgi:hypothetical protein